MKLNREALIKALKSHEAEVGYTLDTALDDEKLLAAIKSIIADHNIELEGIGDDTVDAIFARKEAPKPRLRLAVSADTGEVVELKGNRATGVNGTMFQTPKMSRIASVIKRYDERKKAGKGGLFDSGDQAMETRAWFRSKCFPQMEYAGRAEDEAIAQKIATTINPSAGGVLIPEDYRAVLIDNIETYGAARQIASVMPMRRDTLDNPKRDADFTGYWPGEAGSITASDQTLSGVGVTARKLTALGRVSSELFHDSELNFMDLATQSMARSFALKEDQAYFLGDASTTYGHIRGYVPAIRAVDSTIANIYSIQVATGNLMEEFTVADFVKTLGRVKSFTFNESPKWVMSTTAYNIGYLRAAMAQGGVTISETSAGGQRMQCVGFPVVFSQVMPITDSNSQGVALFGAFNRGAFFGDVLGGMAIEVSNQRYFDTDEIAIRAIERIAISVYDPGSTSAYGPVAALYSAAS